VPTLRERGALQGRALLLTMVACWLPCAVPCAQHLIQNSHNHPHMAWPDVPTCCCGQVLNGHLYRPRNVTVNKYMQASGSICEAVCVTACRQGPPLHAKGGASLMRLVNLLTD
jgi:hypothetical protein